MVQGTQAPLRLVPTALRLRGLPRASATATQPATSAEEELDDDARMIASIGLAYDPARIEAYFAERPEELGGHASYVWATLRGLAVPALVGAFLTWVRLSAGNTKPEEREWEASWSSLRREFAPRVVDALSQLGPTYIKFGQSLASRPDIVSAEIASELTRLQDAVPPFDGKVAQQILAQELSGRGPAAEELLASLKGAQPVAAASLGQVYKGRVGGRDVAVKVQRPEARRGVAKDAALLKAVARDIAALRIPKAKVKPSESLRGDVVTVPLVRADVVGAVDEFCSRLFEELDYAKEAANIERFAGLYGANGEHAARIPAPGVRVPQLLHELCTRRVLVMEWIEGERLTPAEPDGSSAVSKGDLPLVEIGIAATLLQLLETGVMHTDPHGGNLWKAPWRPPAHAEGDEQPAAQEPSSQLVYLDFGLIADVPLQVRNGLVCAVMYIVRKRWDRVASLFNQLMLLPDWVLQDERTLASFTSDIEAAARVALDFENAGSDGVPSLRFSALLEQLVLLAPRYQFRLPPYFLNNARAIGCLEGMARSADPDFNILRRMYPFALRRLLSNPSNSPVVRQTLRDLARDERTGWLSRRAALELVDAAASLQGATRREVLKELLRTRGGCRFALEVMAGECLSVVETAAERGFGFVDRWAIRARQTFFPAEVWEPEPWELEEERAAEAAKAAEAAAAAAKVDSRPPSTTSSSKAASSSSSQAATAAKAKSPPPSQASSSSKAAAAAVAKAESLSPSRASSSSKTAAAAAEVESRPPSQASSSSKKAAAAAEVESPPPSQASSSSSKAAAAAAKAESPPPSQASSSSKAAAAKVESPRPSTASSSKAAAAKVESPPTEEAPAGKPPEEAAAKKEVGKPLKKAVAKTAEKPSAKPPKKKAAAKKAAAKNKVEEKPPPPPPPGEHWTKYDDEGVLWYYYEGPHGRWWCEEGSPEIKRYVED